MDTLNIIFDFAGALLTGVFYAGVSFAIYRIVSLVRAYTSAHNVTLKRG